VAPGLGLEFVVCGLWSVNCSLDVVLYNGRVRVWLPSGSKRRFLFLVMIIVLFG